MRRRNLVACLAMGYSPAAVSPFLNSLSAVSRDCDLHVFIKQADAASWDKLTDVEVTICDDYIEAFADLGQDYSTARHFLYRNLLRKKVDLYDTILLTDCRDVIFQGEEFLAVKTCKDVFFASEDSLIANCHHNSHWIDVAYGQAALAEMARFQILCVGTILGGQQGVLGYLEQYCEEVCRVARRVNMDHTWGVEQAIHNRLFYVLENPCYKALPNHTLISTLGHTLSSRVSVDSGSIMVDGIKSAIVHQYDRMPSVRDEYLRSQVSMLRC